MSSTPFWCEFCFVFFSQQLYLFVSSIKHHSFWFFLPLTKEFELQAFALFLSIWRDKDLLYFYHGFKSLNLSFKEKKKEKERKGPALNVSIIWSIEPMWRVREVAILENNCFCFFDCSKFEEEDWLFGWVNGEWSKISWVRENSWRAKDEWLEGKDSV